MHECPLKLFFAQIILFRTIITDQILYYRTKYVKIKYLRLELLNCEIKYN
jgi:hypothetical protein